jgi:GTP-binding protein
MFQKQEFVKAVFNLDELPKDRLPAVVLCGRSNVGKSSFINSLFNRKDLAKTSSTPGKTRSINFYRIDDKFYIVDLPGYGYAKTSKKEREKWGKLIETFLHGNSNLFLVFHFIDSRHNPTDLDVRLNMLMQSIKLPYVIILTKTDKLNQSELSKIIKIVREYFPEVRTGENLFPYSTIKKTGKKEILKLLSALLY